VVSAILPLEAVGLTLRKRGQRLVGPVDLRLEAGGITVLIGPNGAGKTSLLRLLHGLERPSAGSLHWAAPLEEARRRQGFVFQSPIMMRRNVRDSLAYPLDLLGVPRRVARARAEDWAARVGLGDALNRPASVLSGGERQKLALARADPRAGAGLPRRALRLARRARDARDRGDPAGSRRRRNHAGHVHP